MSWSRAWPTQAGYYWFYVTGGQNPNEGSGPYVVEVTEPGGGQGLYFTGSPLYMPENIEGYFSERLVAPAPPATPRSGA